VRFFLLLLFSFQLTAGTVFRETTLNGEWLDVSLNDRNRIIELVFSDGSRIAYDYVDEKLQAIVRYNSLGTKVYSQTYAWNGTTLQSHSGWFTTNYIYDETNTRVVEKINPWLHETIQYDSFGNPTIVGDTNYTFDALNQITSESNRFNATYDNQLNLLHLDEQQFEINENNQIQGLQYDSRGNLVKEGFLYDDQSRLIEAQGEHYAYDPYGRRVQKDNVQYLYLGCEEIASFENGQCKTLKIPGIGGPIAIEIEGKPYAPVVDSRGIITKLIDPETNFIFAKNTCDIFGNGLTGDIPYAYRGKRFDPNTGLIYFAMRYYDPALHRWLTPDPLGTIDHENLYQYCANNPLRYWDPTGCSFWGYAVGCAEIFAGGAIMVGGLGIQIATCGGFTIGFSVVEGAGFALIANGLARTTYEARDMKPLKWAKGYSENSYFENLHKNKPRFDGQSLGLDPSECPGEGFEWRGTGSPESGKGNWLNPSTGEKLHPDLRHPDPKGPHWGYKDANGIPYDLFLDGSWL
jgi:RHS repeat-associated protein